MLDATGTIGSRPCEKSLNRILAECEQKAIEKGEKPPRFSVLKHLEVLRFRIKQIEHIPDVKTRKHIRMLLLDEVMKKIDSINDATVISHAKACVKAYFRASQ